MAENNDLIQKLLMSGMANKESDGVSNEGVNEADFFNLNPENMDPKQLEQLIAQLYGNKEPGMEQGQDKQGVNPNFKSFIPEPGFCLKSKTDKDEKVFLNVCQSIEIACPKDISENDLKELIAKQNDNEMIDASFQFRVPMSLGEPHEELDNSGQACVACDICINPVFFKKIQENTTFMGFFMSLVIDGLENKYSIRLDRNCKMLTNKKFFGKLNEQYVRIKSKPIISEVDAGQSSVKKPVEMLSEVSDNKRFSSEVPKYKIFREPQDENMPVEFLVAEIELPNLVSSKSLTLNIGEDRILLTTRSELYILDIYLAYNLNQDECGAQFDKKSRRLTITIPVVNNDS